MEINVKYYINYINIILLILYTHISGSIATYYLVLRVYQYMFVPYKAFIRRMTALTKLSVCICHVTTGAVQ
jgi:hypothetical protein